MHYTIIITKGYRPCREIRNPKSQAPPQSSFSARGNSKQIQILKSPIVLNLGYSILSRALGFRA